jgi:hypothetical protein
LFDKQQDVYNPVKFTKCTCGNKEEVEIYSNYGGGFYFLGEACRNCKYVNAFYEEDGLGCYWIKGIKHGKPNWLKEKV